jgi:hypothetical protein
MFSVKNILLNEAKVIDNEISKKFLEIREQLSSKGVSDEILEEVFGQNEGTTNSEDEDSVIVSHPRMLGPNNDSESKIIRTTNNNNNNYNNNYNNSDRVPIKKYNLAVDNGEIIFVLNYTDKSHAIFGDFAKTYLGFKNSFLKEQTWIKYCEHLAFGAGWVFKNTKPNVDSVKKALTLKKLGFEQIEKEKLIIRLEQNNKPRPTTKNNNTTTSSTSTTSTCSTTSVTNTTSTSSTTSTNKNVRTYEDVDENSIAFCKAPIGVKGKMTKIFIGTVNSSSSKKNFENIDPIDESLKKELIKKGYKSNLLLSHDIITTIKKYDKKLSENLKEILDREEKSEEKSSESETSEETSNSESS